LVREKQNDAATPCRSPMIRLAVSTQITSVTNRQTDRIALVRVARIMKSVSMPRETVEMTRRTIPELAVDVTVLGRDG